VTGEARSEQCAVVAWQKAAAGSTPGAQEYLPRAKASTAVPGLANVSSPEARHYAKKSLSVTRLEGH
jgi:hypothetical protein